MKKSVKLALRASEIRSDINKLDPGEDTLAKRRELLGQLDTVETEYRAALTEEAEAETTQPGADGLTPEEREFRQLESRAELRNVVHAVMDGRPLTGAEKELQEHRGLSGTDIPWDVVAPRPSVRSAEHRADAVSAAPSDSHLQQHGILGRVFARSATMTLGVAMPAVAVGEQNYPVITTTDEATILAKDAAEGDAADAGITAHVIDPKRIQRSYVFRREDQAVLSGLEEALRNDLSMAVGNLLDKQVIAGDGTTGAQFAGFLGATSANGGLGDRSDSPARLTFQLAAGEVARGIDGVYAGGLGECAVVVGDDTARDMASKFQNQDSDSALAYMMRTTGRSMASAHVPAVASMFQEGVLARTGAAGMNAVCPVWDRLFMIRDEVTGRKSGQIALTIGMLAGFDILRAGGFDRLKFKVA